jgi:hypothetical protein
MVVRFDQRRGDGAGVTGAGVTGAGVAMSIWGTMKGQALSGM